MNAVKPDPLRTIRTQIKGTEPQHYRAVVKETESLLQFEICSRTNKPF